MVLPIITFLAYMAELQGFSISTIYNRFSTDINGVVFKGIPSVLPTFNLPWQLSDSSGSPLGISFEMVRELIAPAFTIALLAAIESLLAAVVADGMAHTKHDPDSELIALGVSNLICPFFGGIPATGALARTATNIKFGARSPVSSLAHGIFTLLAVIFMARFISL